MMPVDSLLSWMRQEGVFDIEANAEGQTGANDTDVFVVASEPLELASTRTNRALLEALSKWCGGVTVDSDDTLKSLARNEPLLLQVNRRKDVPIWSNVWILILALIIPSLEWFLRRRWGLL